MSSVAHTGSGGRVQIVMVEELQKGMGHHWGDRKCVCVCGGGGGGNHWGERKLMLPLGLLFSLWCIFSEDIRPLALLGQC